MQIIAIEEHFLTKDVRDAWASLDPADRDGAGSLHLGEIEDRLDNLGDGRIELMGESGVDVQVLSLTTPALYLLERGERVV
jgi:hypothetical protein